MSLFLGFDANDRKEDASALSSLSFPDDVFVVGIDLNSPAEAIARTISAKRRGLRVAMYPVLTDALERTVEQVMTAVDERSDAEQRRVQLAAMSANKLVVSGRALSDWPRYTPPQRDAAVLAAGLADIILTTTSIERARWADIVGKPIERHAYLPTPSPDDAAALDTGITIYAPSTDRHALRLLQRRLVERRFDCSTIASDTPNELPRTQTVICPEWWRPLRALAMAVRGHKVVTPAHGSDERYSGIMTYSPTDAFSVSAAIDRALSSSTTTNSARLDFIEAAALIEELPAAPEDVPLVSIIVRTYDRAALLSRALVSIAAQSYPNIEILVVNNGGPDVRETAERACGSRTLRYVQMSERRHIGAASNAGARRATGLYVGYLDDDDLLYPDHVARAVGALQQSHADLVYANCVGEYAVMRGNEKHVLGFRIFRDREFDLDDIYVENVAPIHSIAHRRDCFERFGYFDESLAVTDDWEMWLRIARGGRIVHVDRATCEYSWRYDPARGNMTLSHSREFADYYRIIVDRYRADVAGRPRIQQRQEQAYAIQRQRADDNVAHPERSRGIVVDQTGLVPVGAAVSLL